MFSAALQRVLAVEKGLIEADAEPPIPSALVTTPLFHVNANNCVAHGTTLPAANSPTCINGMLALRSN